MAHFDCALVLGSLVAFARATPRLALVVFVLSPMSACGARTPLDDLGAVDQGAGGQPHSQAGAASVAGAGSKTSPPQGAGGATHGPAAGPGGHPAGGAPASTGGAAGKPNGGHGGTHAGMGGTVSGEGGFGGGADECSSCFAMAETGACLATSAWCFKDISYCAGADACIRSSGCLQAPTEAKLISCAEALCGAEHFQIWLGYSHCPFCFCKASCPAAAELCPGAGTQGAGGAG